MIACYDLARCPPTYDAVAFLALAELERKRRAQNEWLDVHVLPGPMDGFRADYYGVWPYSQAGREVMRNKVLLPLMELLPSVRRVSIHRTYQDGRKVVGWGAGENFIGLPHIVEALRGGSRPLRAPTRTSRVVQDEAVGKYITFTLREADHWPERNSNVPEWIAAARALEWRHKFRVVFVRDTAAAHTITPGIYNAATLAATQIPARAKVYGNALLNVGVCNGPMWMSIFMNAPTLMLRPTCNELGGCYDDAFYAQCGIPRGGQLPTSPKHQRLAWCGDSRAEIIHEVEAMLEAVR